jgi:putative peptidoglycan lipid II flippase
MKLVAPGFTPEQMSVTVTLTRIMFLSPIFLGMSGIIGGVVQSFKRFFVYSLAPIFYNIGIIVGALFLVPFFGIYGLAWGVVLGALAHLLVQIPTFFHLGFRYQPFLNFKDTNIRKIFVMMVPRTLSLAVSQINFLVVTVIGSALAAGSITVFTFANNIQSLPLGIFGISFAIAAFPTLSEQTNHPKKFVESFRTTLNQILFFIIPTSVLFIILRAQIIRVVLGSGNFNWEDTILTMDALALFSLSLFAQSLIPLFARAFFAFHDSRSPFIVGFISVLINIGLSLVLAPKMGVLGLALSFSVSATVQLIFLWFWLHKKLHTLSELKMLVPFLKVLFASLFLAMATQGTKHVIEPLFGTDTFFGIFIQGFTAGFVGILIYVVICVALRVEEAIIFITSLQKKLFKKFKPFEISDIVE